MLQTPLNSKEGHACIVGSPVTLGYFDWVRNGPFHYFVCKGGPQGVLHGCSQVLVTSHCFGEFKTYFPPFSELFSLNYSGITGLSLSQVEIT